MSWLLREHWCTNMNQAVGNLAEQMERGLDAEQLTLLREAAKLAWDMGVELYLVGGPVRDLLLQRPQLDLDLVVAGDGLGFAQAWADVLGADITVHKPFLTATVVLGEGRSIDVATARRESYEHPGALPTVQPASIEEDLTRRDFTINALAVALNPDRWGEVLDPWEGQRDLQAGLIRVLHDESFIDDPTRLIRAVGFEVRLDFSLEEHTLELLQAAVNESALDLISAQRRAEVLLPLLDGELAPQILARMGELGLLGTMNLGSSLSGELQRKLGEVPAALEALDAPGTGRSAALARLALVCHDAGTTAATLIDYLQLPGEDGASLTQAMAALASPPPQLTAASVSPADLYFALERYSLVALAALWVSDQALAGRRIQQYGRRLRHIESDITGDDLVEAGAQPGPGFSQALREALRVKLNVPSASAEEQLQATLEYLESVQQ